MKKSNSKLNAVMKRINLLVAGILVAILAFYGCSQRNQGVRSNIVSAEAPDALDNKQQGYILPGTEHGLMQSPINIKTGEALETDDHGVVLNYKKSSEKVVNLGHTIQVNYDKGNTISFDNKVYDFKQFHFHTPSEHLIDGITYPMEMHMVHTLQGQKPDATPQYCVVAILFKEGKENPFLNEFIDAIPQDAGTENEVTGGYVNINDILDMETDLEYYHYQGSLTTPPYTETVTWLIYKQVVEASQEQIARFNKLEGNNARHIQALYGRVIEID